MNIKPITILSTVLAIFFIVSGWLKAIDPFGGALKIEEYLAAFNLAAFDSYAMVLSILLCTFEISLGLLLLFGVCRRLTSVVVICMMFAFTTLTAYLSFDPYIMIQECGCFGEAINLTNIESFVKNIIILSIVIVYAILIFQQRRVPSKLVVVIPIIMFSLFIPLYSYIYLPPFDFLSYNRGVDLSKSELGIYNIDNNEVTDFVLNESTKSQLWFIAHESLSDNSLSKIQSIIDFYQGNFTYQILSSLKQSNIENITQYYVNEITLKELIRAKNGVVLIQDKIIKGKWNLEVVGVQRISTQHNAVLKYWIFIILVAGVAFLIYIIIT